MIFMEEVRTTRLNQVATYLERYKGEETIRSVAERAEVSHSIVGALFARKSLPKAANLLSIGQALGANVVALMELAGYLPEGSALAQNINDPGVLAMAYRLEDLSPDERMRTIVALEAMMGAARTSTVSDDAKQARIRELKAAIRAAQQYLNSLEDGQ
jgi:hypothetical protein